MLSTPTPLAEDVTLTFADLGDYTGTIYVNRYHDGGLHLDFVDPVAGELITGISTNLRAHGLMALDFDDFFIKEDYDRPNELERRGLATSIRDVTYGPFCTRARWMRLSDDLAAVLTSIETDRP